MNHERKLCRICWLSYRAGTYKSHVKGLTHQDALRMRAEKREATR
jgi:hypothetical protein